MMTIERLHNHLLALFVVWIALSCVDDMVISSNQSAGESVISTGAFDQNLFEFSVSLTEDFGTFDPCDPNPCTTGMRCETLTQEDGTLMAECVQRSECDQVICNRDETCVMDENGAYCTSVTCASDQECLDDSYCDFGTQRCVADVCIPGAFRCEGDTLLQCSFNGSEESTVANCGMHSSCIEDDAGDYCGCVDDWDCPNVGNASCDSGRCIGLSLGEQCTLPPVPFEESLPIAEIQWGSGAEELTVGNINQLGSIHPFGLSSQVVTTPMVANLTDDNGDGKIDEKDSPEIIFMSFCNGSFRENGVLRAIHGGGENKGADYFAVLGDWVWREGDPLPAHEEYHCNQATLDSTATLAVGDLDPLMHNNNQTIIGVPGPEIIALNEGRGFSVFAHDGRLLINTNVLDVPINKNPAISISNLDAQGPAEVIIGNVVITFTYDEMGQLQVKDQFVGRNSTGTNGQGPISCVADLNLDQQLEVISGGSLYQLPHPPAGANSFADCASNGGMIEAQNEMEAAWCRQELYLLWDTRQVNGIQAATEGFCAVADILGGDQMLDPGPANPLDQIPELILISSGKVQIFNGQTGVLLRDLPQNLGENGGAPNVGDFDGDGFPEIGSAFARGYVMIDLQTSSEACPPWPSLLDDYETSTMMRVSGQVCMQNDDCGEEALCQASRCVCLHNSWRKKTEDDSSRVTGSTLFDFNGDGSVEVVYNDECWFRIYEGRTGKTLLKEASESRTRIENPIVADVDSDGNAEIIFSTSTESGFCSEREVWKEQYNAGIEVWGDPNDRWVPARRIWNQHAYHITHVYEDGRIPLSPQNTWDLNQDYNSFRAQPSSDGVAPDLQALALSVTSNNGGCGIASDDPIEIRTLVSNQGEVLLGGEIPMIFEGLWQNEWRVLSQNNETLRSTLGAPLSPGMQRFITVRYDATLDEQAQGVKPNKIRVVLDPVSNEQPFGLERECREDNNTREFDLLEDNPFADLTVRIEELSEESCPRIRLRISVSNQGERDAAATEVSLYAGDPSQGGVRLKRYPIDALSVGATQELNIESPSIPLSRDILLFIAIDPSNQIIECNEDNTVMANRTVRCILQDGF